MAGKRFPQGRKIIGAEVLQPQISSALISPVMAGNESVAYRRNAADCVEMAKEFSEPESELILLNMAQAWLRLVDLTEKFGDNLGSELQS
jgi:hypothetical protein